MAEESPMSTTEESVACTPQPRRAGGVPEDELTPSPPRAPIGTRGGKARVQSSTPPSATKLQTSAVATRLTKTKMCYFFEKGKCGSSDCRYAHSESELRQAPDLQKTKICKAWQDGHCDRGDGCIFAHGERELRVTDGIYKTQMCHFFERGRCLKGTRCNHAHGPEDMQPRKAPALPKHERAPSPLRLANLLGDSPPAREGARLPAEGIPELPPFPLVDPYLASLWPNPYLAQDFGYYPSWPGQSWDPFMPPLMPPPVPQEAWDPESGMAVLDQVSQDLSSIRAKFGEGAMKVSLERELENAKDSKDATKTVHRI